MSDTLIKSPSFGDFIFDAVISAEHSREVTVTSHPVQYGAEISDHSYLEPETVNLSIGMSDVMSDIGQAAHSVNAHAQLVQMMQARELVTLVTRLGTYEDMIISSMSTPDDFATMNGIKAQIGFRHVNIVTAAVVLIQNKVSSSKGGYKPPETTEEEVDPDDHTENESIAQKLWKGITAVVGYLVGDESQELVPSGMKMSWEQYKGSRPEDEVNLGYYDVSKAINDAGKTGTASSVPYLDKKYPNATLGTGVTWNGIYYVKTSDGWKAVS